MEIKRLIFNCLPYKLAINRINRNKVFEKDFLDYYQSDKRRIYDSVLHFNNVVSVCGYGYSGSGAVVDLLREYSECKVLGGVDKEGSQTNKKDEVGEIDILRLSGGLFELEKYIQTNNTFQNDAAVNRLIKLFDNSPIINCSIKNRELAYSFLKDILELVIPNLSRTCYNLHLKSSIHESSSIYFLRHLDLQMYRSICRNFLYSLLNDFYTNGDNFLVADQLFADLENNIERNLEYIPSLKTISVFRDPRDVFEYATSHKIQWIPFNNIDDYIKWVDIQYLSYKEAPSVLNLRFEELVNDYPTCVQKVEEFLGLSPKNHVGMKKNFNPDFSRRNIGIWKNSSLNSIYFERIEEHFPRLCFNV